MGWQTLPGRGASTPVPVMGASRIAHVFCVTTAGAAAVISGNGRSWGQWSTLPASPVNLSGVPAIVINRSGQLVFCAGTTAGGLADAWQRGAGTWPWGVPLVAGGGWRSARVAGSPATAHFSAGQVIVYARRANGRLEYIRQTGWTGSAAWGRWSTIGGLPGGTMVGSPAGWLNAHGAATVPVRTPPPPPLLPPSSRPP